MDTATQRDTLTAPQRRAIVCLLTCPDIASAAQAAKVGRSTLHHWLKPPLFARELDRARQQQVEESLILLRSSMGAAILKARDLLQSESPAVALKAASLLLDHAMKLHSERSMPYRDVMRIQEVIVTLILETVRELHLPEQQIRQRFTEKFKALKEGGLPVMELDPMPNGTVGNGHAA